MMSTEAITTKMCKISSIFCLLPAKIISRSNTSTWHKFYAAFWILLLGFSFQWSLRGKTFNGIYDAKDLLIYVLLDLCINIAICLANITSVLNAVFLKTAKIRGLICNLRSLEENLGYKTDMVNFKELYLTGLIFLACWLCFTVVANVINSIYLDFSIVKASIPYYVNLMVLMMNFAIVRTFIELVGELLKKTNAHLENTLSEYFKAKQLHGHATQLELGEYFKYYKITFKNVLLLNSLYGTQLLIMAFLNFIVIVYNMHISTMKVTIANDYPKGFVLLISISHTVLYLVSKKKILFLKSNFICF